MWMDVRPGPICFAAGQLAPRPSRAFARILATLDFLPNGPIFRLFPSEDWGAGLRRLVLQQLALAEEQLRLRSNGCDQAVHMARKACKRTRAVLRLLRLTIGESGYMSENQAVRDAARRLSDLRDARVMVDTAGQMRRLATAGEGRIWEGLERALNERLVEEHARAESDGSLEAAIGLLAAVAARAASWRSAADPGTSVAAGLFQTYRRGRRLHRKLLAAEAADELFHSWRKESKCLLHFWIVLRAFQTGGLLAVHGASRQLCTSLGEVNDLSGLRVAIEQGAGDLGGEEKAAALRRLDRRQAELKDQTRHLGHQVYWRDPGELVAAFGLESPRP